jgi:hypothetical protein
MSPLRLSGSTSGFSQLDAPAIAGDQTFTLPSTGGTLDRLNRAGNILQVVNSVLTTAGTTTSSSTYADTGLSASITPTASSSRILVMINLAGCGKGSADTYLRLRLLRGSTDILAFENLGGENGTTSRTNFGSCSTAYLDSPSTTSSTTYKVQFASGLNVASAGINLSPGGGITQSSTITLMEVAA